MSTLNTFLIGAFVGSDCKIKVKDNTDYPISIPPSVAGIHTTTNTAIALFWDTNPALGIGAGSDPGMDLTSPATREWSINTLTGGLYWFVAFIVEIWADHNYSQNDVTFHAGSFYFVNAVAGVASGEPAPEFNSHWTLISPTDTVAANFTIFNTADTTPYYIGSNSCSVNKECGSITYEQTECSTWEFCNTIGTDIYFNVTDVSGTDVAITTDLTPAGTAPFIYYVLPANTCTTIVFPSSGVFIINSNILLDLILTNKRVIYETCKYWTCYNSMIDSILCNDYDPCCETCDNATKRAAEIQRLEINKLQALMNALMSYISYDALYYQGYVTIAADRASLLTKINAIMNKMDTIITRCGLCNGALSTTVNSPCPDCL